MERPPFWDDFKLFPAPRALIGGCGVPANRIADAPLLSGTDWGDAGLVSGAARVGLLALPGSRSEIPVLGLGLIEVERLREFMRGALVDVANRGIGISRGVFGEVR